MGRGVVRTAGVLGVVFVAVGAACGGQVESTPTPTSTTSRGACTCPAGKTYEKANSCTEGVEAGCKADEFCRNGSCELRCENVSSKTCPDGTTCKTVFLYGAAPWYLCLAP